MRFLLASCLLAVLTGCSAPAAAPPSTPCTTSARTDARTRVPSMRDVEVKGYLEGRALDQTLVAEKNHYPSPHYAVRVRSELALFADKEAPLRAIETRTRERAAELGKQLVAEEEKIDNWFATGNGDVVALEAMVRESARLKGEIRLLQLEANVETKKILSPDQVVKYESVRPTDPVEDGL